jgi:hypothetical protein
VFLVSPSKGAVLRVFQEEEAASAHLTADLTGAAEAPGPGDPQGTGGASIFLNPALGEVCFVLTAFNLTIETTNAHIHRGAAGEPGPVVVGLVPPGEDGVSAGCGAAEASLIEEIIDDPDELYVNVHTTEFPAGAIRGQLND